MNKNTLLACAALFLLTACDQPKITEKPAEKPANFAQPQMDAYKKAQGVQDMMNKAEAQKKDDMQAEGL
jgi:uncharacterized lipoprotein YajG